MVSTLDILIIILYLLITIILGMYTGQNVNTFRDYAIGNKKFSTLVLAMTICATWLEGSDIFSATSEVFTVGILYIVACSGGVINNLIVAKIIAPRMDRFQNMMTVGEILGSVYNKPIRIFTGISGFLICLGFIAIQIKAMSLIINYFFKLNSLSALILSSFVVIIYTAYGGIKSVTITDVMQFITFMIAIPMIAYIALDNVGGFEGIINYVPASHFSLHPSNPLSIKYLFIGIAYSIPLLSPPVMQRILMAKNKEQIGSSFILSGIFTLFFIILVGVIALCAYTLRPDLNPQECFLYLIDNILPSGFKGIAIIGVLAVIMSSADSFMDAGSISLVHDTIKPILDDENLPDYVQLYITKIVTIIMGLASILMAIYFDNLIDLMLYSYNLWGPVVVMPLFMLIFGYKFSNTGCLLAMSAGVLTVIYWKYIGQYEALTGIDSIIPALLMNLLVLLLSGLYDFKESKKLLEQ